ncbi:putative phosphoesterase [Dyella lipolytica]|uniref:2'-5' RNA ligase family protein n=1 Tax=Dyella lipolytica TaxID=1867835 RepID=A0ABW8J0Y0_9GAMM|nr:2'-5' RNA ligase family protein [Dyella lipolytica]GLQ45455.1 putative phosphoesterase [Dyella lipolytica]
MNTTHTLLALRLPEADLLIGDLRDKHDPSARRSLGAHITIWFDWKPADQVSEADLSCLAELVATTAPIDITLRHVGYFHGVVYLSPEPALPLHELERRIRAVFTREDRERPRPYVPHVTIGRKLSDETARLVGQEVERRILKGGALVTRCDRLSLLVLQNSHWVPQASFRCGGGVNPK